MSAAPTPLALLLRPRSVALYGASDKSAWSRGIVNATRTLGYDGPMFAINRSASPAHGLPGFRSATQIGAPVDTACVLAPAASVPQVFDDMAQAGIRTAVVLSSGFSETGPEGAAAQQRLLEQARRHGITFMGPNSMGVAHIAARSGLCAFTVPEPVLPGGLACVSQSGSMCVALADYALQQGVGLSFMAAMGNEAMVDLCDVVEHLMDDPATRAIGVCAATVRNPARFVAVARRALAVRKPIVVLKLGRGARSAAIAPAHTGALTGDDAVFDAVCRHHGVLRADSLEDLVGTAALLAHTGPIGPGGIAYVSPSGGACSVFAEAAERAGLPMPALAPATLERLRSVLPDDARTDNPFDTTGAVINDPTLLTHCLQAIADDPGVALTVCGYTIGSKDKRSGTRLPLMQAAGAALAPLGPRALLASHALRPSTPLLREAQQAVGIPFVTGGIAHLARSLAKAIDWSARLAAPPLADAGPAGPAGPACERPVGERAVLRHLQRHGVPVVPTLLAATAVQAQDAARQFRSPVALKVSAPDVAHKTEAGGVRLDVRGDTDVSRAFGDIVRSVHTRRPEALIEGVAVSPMRRGGVELRVSVTRDAAWGPLLAVGLGGIWSEVLTDVQMRPLPLRGEEIAAMLRALRGFGLLAGARGQEPADLHGLVRAIESIGDAALALHPAAAVLQVNALRVAGRQIEALNGLVTWPSDGA
ncbi:acetate--CoA ligase family protein [Pseudorhodoferax sp. Leaf267]|uniref:acetate--CoA ligase family protein n=1 Tax=Pseudorhodoferax sp. Leaf267 TaxID=1736316 RepID=UPI00138F3610|nr:acetate--CoA ligase family protein [Pseudorhodoferax sp. Leaf267]